MKKTCIFLLQLILLVCAFSVSEAVCAPQKKETKMDMSDSLAVLEADAVGFDEQNGMASAEGHAVLRYMGITLRADRISMDTNTNIARAYADEGKRVLIRQGETDNLEGSFLEYHLDDSTGYLEMPDGTSKVLRGAVFVKSKQVEFAPPDIAHEKKWIHGKYLKKTNPDDTVLKWNTASYTTCPEEKPHYLLRSKKISMLPGRYIVLHRPRVYAGSAYLFTMPFNMLVNQRRKRSTITIMPNYDDDKHAGVEVSSTVSPWEGSKLYMQVGSWAAGITEARVRFDQRVTDWFSVYGGVNRVYDDDLEETKARPFWGAVLAKDDWKMEIGWAEREKKSIVKRAGQSEYETTLWRDPEIKLTTPWVGLHTGSLSQYVRGKGNWGRFQETGTNTAAHTDFIERYGWGIDYYTEYPFRLGAWTISPFIKGDYWNYGYKNDDSDRQIISILTYGFRASQGIFEMGTAFKQRRVSGKTAFRRGWDSYDDEDSLYQRVGFKLSKNLSFAVQGIAEMTRGEPHVLTSVGYILSYDNNCCTSWSITYNDDCTKDDDNWISVSFAINAFPDATYKFGNHSLENPFSAPVRTRRNESELTLMERDGFGTMGDDDIVLPVFDI